MVLLALLLLCCFWKVLSFELWLWGAAVCHLPREMLYVKPLYTQDLDLTFKHNIWLAILVLWIGWRCVVCCVLGVAVETSHGVPPNLSHLVE